MSFWQLAGESCCLASVFCLASPLRRIPHSVAGDRKVWTSGSRFGVQSEITPPGKCDK